MTLISNPPTPAPGGSGLVAEQRLTRGLARQQLAGFAVEHATQGVERFAFDAFGARVLEDGVEALAMESGLSGNSAGRHPRSLQRGFEGPVNRHGPKMARQSSIDKRVI